MIELIGILNVVEGDFTVLHQRSKSSTQPQSNIDIAFETVLSNRFITRYVMSNIPATLAMYCKGITGSGRQFIDIPSSPFDRQSLSPSPKRDNSRVLLHAYAERLAGSSQIVAEEEATRQHDVLSVGNRNERVSRQSFLLLSHCAACQSSDTHRPFCNCMTRYQTRLSIGRRI